uniref:Uncharacterized protein n=1 Tax=Astyanax mexicanus TaxID=7994 RepID=A0A8B9KBK1_ASTMX
MNSEEHGINQGANGAAKDMDGCSALHYAAGNGHESVAATLLTSGKNKNVDDRNVWRRTPLHLAAEHGQDILVDLLLEKQAKINAMDNNKDTNMLEPLLLRSSVPLDFF